MLEATIRVRTVAWFATSIVLAVVCTLLVTQAWSVDAAPGDDDTTFVPTAGCRLADTRPGPDNIGPRSTPIGAGGIFEATVHGSNGQCTGALAIPTDATAVALNVTSVNPTATSNIRLYPANLASVPLLSNLNVTPGGPATPNKVDVKLSPDGKLRVFNQVGSVDVILDVIGYYTNSTLQELSQRVVALEAADTATAAGIDPAILARITALERAQPFAVTNRTGFTSVNTTAKVVVSVDVTAPVSGQVTLNSTTNAGEDDEGDNVRCTIRNDSLLFIENVGGIDYVQEWESPGSLGNFSQLSGTRTFAIAAGATVNYRLVCDHFGTSSSGTVNDSVLTAIFTPAP